MQELVLVSSIICLEYLKFCSESLNIRLFLVMNKVVVKFVPQDLINHPEKSDKLKNAF